MDVIEKLRNFIAESKTCRGVTFSGCYDMNTEDFLEMFRHYLEFGENLLDDYSAIIHAAWDSDSLPGQENVYHGRPTEEKVGRLKAYLADDAPINIRFVLDENETDAVRNYVYCWEAFYEQKREQLLSRKTRNYPEYHQWRDAVFERDGYTCQKCGKTGGNLNAHHIKSYKKYPKLRLDINNGTTLCETPCHKQEHKAK